MSRLLDDKALEAAARFRDGDYAGADRLCAEVLARQPRHRDALHVRALALLAMGHPAQSKPLLAKALKGGASVPLLDALANAHAMLGEFEEAEATLRKVAALAGNEPDALVRLAQVIAARGRHEDAERVLRDAAARAPHNADVIMALAGMVAAQGRLEDARGLYGSIPPQEGRYADARFNCAVLYERMGDDARAAAAYADLVDRFPGYADAHSNLGVLRERNGDIDGAVAAYRAALRGDPRHVAALANLGKALRVRGDLDGAEAACRTALAIAPADAAALTNLGNVLVHRGDGESAVRCFREALANDPGNADASLSLAMLCLARGEYAEGWARYAARPTRLRAVAARAVLGDVLPENLPGRRIVLLAEQGLGDELFFLRFVPQLAAEGAIVAYQCDPRLAGMMARTGWFESLSHPGALIPESDVRMLIGDLPHLLALYRLHRTHGSDSDAIPPPAPLVPLPEKLEAAHRLLSTFGPPPYTGLTWRAGTARIAQRADEPVLDKSLPLDALDRVLPMLRGTVIVLQRDPALELERVRAMCRVPVGDCSGANGDLELMLALLAQLDDYIAVSNTNVHLRAALGRSARVLVPHPPEWRWMRAGDRSPWFPHAKVYRQQAGGDWHEALEALAADFDAGRH